MESIMHHFLSWLNPATMGQLQKSLDLPYVLDDNELEAAAGGCHTVVTGNPKDCDIFPPVF